MEGRQLRRIKLHESPTVACKRRLPARRLLCILARFIEARGGRSRPRWLAAWGDVLVLDADGPTNGRALMMAFLEFLQPGAALRPAMQN